MILSLPLLLCPCSVPVIAPLLHCVLSIPLFDVTMKRIFFYFPFHCIVHMYTSFFTICSLCERWRLKRMACSDMLLQPYAVAVSFPHHLFCGSLLDATGEMSRTQILTSTHLLLICCTLPMRCPCASYVQHVPLVMVSRNKSLC